jgi:hypothetical protein
METVPAPATSICSKASRRRRHRLSADSSMRSVLVSMLPDFSGDTDPMPVVSIAMLTSTPCRACACKRLSRQIWRSACLNIEVGSLWISQESVGNGLFHTYGSTPHDDEWHLLETDPWMLLVHELQDAVSGHQRRTGWEYTCML